MSLLCLTNVRRGGRDLECGLFCDPPGSLDASRALAPNVVIEAPRSGQLIKDGREGSVFFVYKGLLMISFCFVTELIRRLHWW